MNNNSLKSKFDDFKPSPKPGDWEQMEILLERSKFKYGFLISIMMAVMASGGLLFLYGHMYIPDNLDTEISNYASINIDEGNANILNQEKQLDAVETDSEIFHGNNVALKKKESIDSRFSINNDSKYSGSENLNIENKSHDQIGNIGLATKTKNAEAFHSESEEDLLTISKPHIVQDIEELSELPMNKYEVVEEKKEIELSPAEKLKRKNLSFMSVSLGAYRPIVYFNPSSSTSNNLQSSLGVNFHRGNAFIGANVSISNLSLGGNTNLDRYIPIDNSSSFRRFKYTHTLSLHLDVRAGYSFRLWNKVNITPYLGLGVISQNQSISQVHDESSILPDFSNSEDFILADATTSILFVQAGASFSYLINARWSVHADCSYQQSLSREKMSLLSPGIGLSYRFHL